MTLECQEKNQIEIGKKIKTVISEEILRKKKVSYELHMVVEI